MNSAEAVTQAKTINLPIKDIIVVNRGRKDLGDIVGLAISIKIKGLINPILVQAEAGNKYRLIAGERRLRAYIHNKAESIPAKVLDLENLDEYVLFDLELHENIDRLALRPDEEILLKARVNDMKMKQFGKKDATNPDGWTQEQTADMFNESAANISRDLSIAPIIKAIPEAMRKQCKTKGELRSLVEKLANEYVNVTAAQKIKDEVLSNGQEGTDRLKKKLIDSYIIGDAMDMLATLGDCSVGFVHCDSDYGTDIMNLVKRNVGTIIDPYVQYDPKEFEGKFKTAATECYRVLRDDSWAIFWFGGQHQKIVYTALAEIGFDVGIPLPWIWVKTKGQTNLPTRYPCRAYETFAYVRKGNAKLYIKGLPDATPCEGVPGGTKRHRAEKPVELCSHILKVFSKPDDFVVDVFAGSGNMLLACANRGNEVLGCDLIKKFKDGFTIAVATQEYGKYTSFKKQPASLPANIVELAEL